MNFTLVSYGLYILIMLLVIIRAGHALYDAGFYLLLKTFDDKQVAKSVNAFLLMGYYLLNVAYVLMIMREEREVLDLKGIFDLVSEKSGLIILLLACIHFLNLLLCGAWKRYSNRTPASINNN